MRPCRFCGVLCLDERGRIGESDHATCERDWLRKWKAWAEKRFEIACRYGLCAEDLGGPDHGPDDCGLCNWECQNPEPEPGRP